MLGMIVLVVVLSDGPKTQTRRGKTSGAGQRHDERGEDTDGSNTDGSKTQIGGSKRGDRHRPEDRQKSQQVAPVRASHPEISTFLAIFIRLGHITACIFVD